MMTTALEATDKDFERMMQMLTNFFCDTDSRCCGVTETTEMSTGNSANKLWRRRDVIKLLGATAIAGPVILRGTTAKAASSKVIKIGHVSPQTGAFAPFAEGDPFILNQIRTALAKGITNGGASYEVQIISKDSQSNTNRATEVAADLILKDKVDMLVASSVPETTNLVADQAEANETLALRITLPGSPTSLVDTAHRTKVSLGHTISFGAWKM